MYRRLRTIRSFEEAVAALYRDGEIPGFVHLSVGQEAAAVGACWPLREDDVITSTHRGHAHCIAKGLSIEAMFAELMARGSGSNGGLGGSMHIADPNFGIFGANGIVAAGLPIALGAAASMQLKGEDRVAVGFFGDGAIAQGAFHETLNLAALWGVPLVLFCENNQYAEFASTASQHPVPISERAANYGIPFEQVDGNDVVMVTAVMDHVVERVRRGEGPWMIEAQTYRMRGHYEGDPESYRNRGDEDSFHDPLDVARKRYSGEGLPAGDLDKIDRDVAKAISDAAQRAREAEFPVSGLHRRLVRTESPEQPSDEESEFEATSETKLMDAVRAALEDALEEDPTVFLAGVDVGEGGNVFGLTRGLHDRWPDRVRDTPISETAIAGLAVGSAMDGLRPVVEIMYLDFIGVCFDQILNQAAKLHFMTGGRARLGLTIRTQFGAGRSSGSQHSQSLEALLAHIPGLTVLMPSTPRDAYGLLRSAIDDPNPVIFIENRLTYGKKGPTARPGSRIPIGRARIVRPGKDVTVVSYSRMVHEALAAAEIVAAEGIDAEVIDLRTIVPLDWTTVRDSLEKTSRLVIAHEAVRDFGVGAELAARAADEAFWLLDAPVKRVGAEPTPAPYAPNLESEWLPDRESVAEAIREVWAV